MDSNATSVENANESRIRTRKVGSFLALAFGIAWVGSIGLYLVGIELGTILGTALLVVVFMWAPAIAAIVTLLRYDEPIRASCGLRRGRLRWVGLAWLTPIAFVGATIGIGTALPDVTFTTDLTAYLLELGMSQEEATEAVERLEAIPGPPSLLLLVQALIVGLTINALAALGEELGWRGLLLSELAPLGFWKVSILTGSIWGIWHAPIILQGHNFPEAPFVGVLVMTVATIAMAPIYTYLTVRAQSVLAATFFHGSFNAVGSLSLVYLAGAGNLLVSPVGVAGIGAAVLLTVVCVIHDRTIAGEEITTGRPLSPWS